MKKLHPIFQAKQVDLPTQMEMSQAELDSLLFPKYFVTWVSDYCNKNQFPLKSFELKNSRGGVFDGTFTRHRDTLMFRHSDEDKCVRVLFTTRKQFSVTKQENDGDWIIQSGYPSNFTWWKSPCSSNFKHPPEGPWIPMSLYQKYGQPVIQNYKFESKK